MQMYRIGPRFNASVTRLDRRGSVDSGLSQVIRAGGRSGPRLLRVGPDRYVNELQAYQTGGGPQVRVLYRIIISVLKRQALKPLHMPISS